MLWFSFEILSRFTDWHKYSLSITLCVDIFAFRREIPQKINFKCRCKTYFERSLIKQPLGFGKHVKSFIAFSKHFIEKQPLWNVNFITYVVRREVTFSVCVFDYDGGGGGGGYPLSTHFPSPPPDRTIGTPSDRTRDRTCQRTRAYLPPPPPETGQELFHLL